MLLIYGANGYTGRLIARTAHEYGLAPVLAGRNAQAVAAIAAETGFETRCFDLDHIDLTGISLVLNCAGPFTRTAARMAGACLHAHAHYIDITGEIEVFEQLHALDAEARTAGVMLLPGAGFDVVPSDCLAAFLHRRLPTATHLTLGISGTGVVSRGTMTTMIEHAGRGGLVRRNGKLTRVKLGAQTRTIDFGEARPRQAVCIPWGDVATAYYSTGIPNIEVYSVLPRGAKLIAPLARHFKWLLLRVVRRLPPGPNDEQLRRGKSVVWAEVTDDNGNFEEARIFGPNGYLLTAHTSLRIAQQVLNGRSTPGVQTPSLAYGPDLILEAPGVERHAAT